MKTTNNLLQAKIVAFFFLLILSFQGQSQQIYSTPGTYQWTVPPCVDEITVKVWGAGGGGGGVIAIMRSENGSEACAGAGGGGGGGFTSKTFSVVPGETYTIEVGAGGVGGTQGSGSYNSGITTQPTAGGTGGTSSFIGYGHNLTATGGTGGGPAGAYNNNNTSDVNAIGSGGTGGIGSGGTFNFTGGNGAAGYILNFSTDKSGGGGGAAGPGGNGGHAPLGSSVGITNPPGGAGQAPGGNGANGFFYNSSNNRSYTGGNGQSYGGAGSGALAHRKTYNVERANGGSGAHGAVIIEYNLNEAPIPPAVASPQEFCYSDNATVGDLVATGTNINWYNTSSGGAPLNSSDELTSGTYYATQTIAGCESDRVEVQVTILNPVPSPITNQEFCESATVENLIPTNGSAGIQWYSSPTGTPLANGEVLTNGTYYVSLTEGGCEGSKHSVTVTINQRPNITPISDVDDICESYTLPPITGTNLTGSEAYYSLPNGGGTSYAPGASITSSMTLYIYDISGDNCFDQESFNITIKDRVIPEFDDIDPFCEGTTAPSLPSSSNNGISGTWNPPTVSNTAGTVSYTFTPNAEQCATEGAMSITVTARTVPTFTNPGPTCVGEAFTLPTNSDNSTPITGTWSPAINVNETTNYLFTPDAGQCATSVPMEVVVNPIVTPVFDDIDPFCEGTTAPSLPSSNNGISGTWNPPTVSNTAGTASYTFTPNAGQCAREEIMSVTVNPTPDFTVDFNSPTACGVADGTITLSGLDGSTSYQVSYNDADGAQGPTSYTTDGSGNIVISGLSAGSYNSITVTTAENCSFTSLDGVILVEPNAPTVDAGSDVEICEGEEITLTASNPDGAAISWNNGVADGVAFAPGVGTHTYTVTATLNNCESTDQIVVTVNEEITPTFDLIDPFCEGTTAPSLPSSNNGISGTWNPPTVSNTAGTASYTFTPNAGQCAREEIMSVTVNPTPDFTVDFNSPTACGVADGTITLSGLDGSTSYQVSYNDVGGTQGPTSYTTDGSGNIVISGLSAGSYNSITVTTVDGCPFTSSDGVILVEPNAPIVSAGDDFIICEGEEITLTALNPDGATITWNNGVADGVEFTPEVGTHTYTVTAELNNCQSSDQVIVIVNSTPDFSVTYSNLTACGVADGTITLSGLDGNTSYQVSYDDANGTHGPTSYTTDGSGNIVIENLPAGSYSSITVTTAENCPFVSPDGINLVEPNAPIVDAGGDVTVCEGEEITLTADNPDGATITWNNGAENGIPFIPTAGTHTYTVTAELNDCVSTDEVSITVTSMPDASIVNFDDFYCIEHGNVNVGTVPSPGVSTFIGDGMIGSTFNPSLAGEGTHTITHIVDNNGCLDTASVTVTVGSFTGLELLSSDTSVCVGAGFVLEAEGAESYVWTGPNGFYENGNRIEVSNASENHSGVYHVVGYGGNGCSAVDSVQIHIGMSEDCFSIVDFVSPNGDGENDTWIITGIENYPNAEVYIYNRWGNLIFEASPYGNDWSGQVNKGVNIGSGNGVVPPGTYFYVIQLNNKENEPIKGYLELQY